MSRARSTSGATEQSIPCARNDATRSRVRAAISSDITHPPPKPSAKSNTQTSRPPSHAAPLKVQAAIKSPPGNLVKGQQNGTLRYPGFSTQNFARQQTPPMKDKETQPSSFQKARNLPRGAIRFPETIFRGGGYISLPPGVGFEVSGGQRRSAAAGCQAVRRCGGDPSASPPPPAPSLPPPSPLAETDPLLVVHPVWQFFDQLREDVGLANRSNGRIRDTHRLAQPRRITHLVHI